MSASIPTSALKSDNILLQKVFVMATQGKPGPVIVAFSYTPACSTTLRNEETL
jgi:hypothetical protein